MAFQLRASERSAPARAAVRLLWTWLVVAWLAPGVAAAGLPGVLPPEAAGYFQRLLPPSELARTADIQIKKDHAVYRFRRGGATADVEVRERSACADPAGSLCLRLAAKGGPGADALASEASAVLDRAARSTTEPSPWIPATEAPPPAAPADAPHRVAPRGNDGPGERSWIAPRGPWRAVGQAFLVIVVAGALLAAFRSLRQLSSRAKAGLAGLFLLALAFRLAAHAVPADIRDVVGMLNTSRRAGWSCYLGLLFEVLPPTHESVWNVHRVLGALTVPLLYAVMRSRFSALAATAGAVALAALPLAARFDATDTPYVPLCAAFFGAILALDHFARSGSRPALGLGLGLLTCAMQLRPEGPWLVVPAAVLLACHRIERRWILRPSVAGIAACFAAINVPFSVWALVGHRSEGSANLPYLHNFMVAGALVGSPWLDFQQSPWPLTLLVVAGGLLAVLKGRPGVCWLVATAVALPFAEGAGGQLCNTRYHLPSIHLACGLAGIAIAAPFEWLWRQPGAPWRPAVASVLAVAIPVAAALPRVDFLSRMWTPQLEFEQFRAGVAALGERCTVVTLLDVQDAGFVAFADPGRIDLVDIEAYQPGPDDGCVVYYRTANCFSPDAQRPEGHAVKMGTAPPSAGSGPDACRAFEERFSLTPIRETKLPAIPYRGERYTRDPLPVGFFRIAPATGDPVSPRPD